MRINTQQAAYYPIVMASDTSHSDGSWVEIIEPESKKTVFVNTLTGDLKYNPPSGVSVKKNDATQWWELNDPTSGNAYYYNASTAQTVWERPPANVGYVINLQRLQQKQAELNAKHTVHQACELSTGKDGVKVAAVEAIISQVAEVTISTKAVDASSTKVVEASSTKTVDACSTKAAEASSTKAVETSSTKAAEVVVAKVPTAPPVPPTRGVSARKDTVPLEQFSEISKTRKVLQIFTKKVPLSEMLAWSTDALTVPMLLTLPSKNRKEALDLFRQVQVYMGDRKVKAVDLDTVCLDIVHRCWHTPALRDEIFLQLCKQTTANANTASCERGWELICIAVTLFPPSKKFFNYLSGYICKHELSTQGRVATYASHASKKLERSLQRGAKRGNNSPSLEEMKQARGEVFQPSVFGNTLEEIMQIHQSSYPGCPVPWVIVTLAQTVIRNNGAQTEGIFRVPGDIDQVNTLKVMLDRGQPPPASLTDPHIPASTIKFWFRDLYDPLIPADLYEDCIQSVENVAESLAIVSRLPPLNRIVLVFIIRFLQVIGAPANHASTKMNFDNLAMVWAPNFLRCPSDDPMMIFNNAKKEMLFVRNLVLKLDTQEIVAYNLGL